MEVETLERNEEQRRQKDKVKDLFGTLRTAAEDWS